ncbi:MAG: hypothetical protein OES64_08400 [Desulfobacteraceae bacterium]|nr:hypothetical protein [Desulfobacteraceae bacterium]
MNGSATPGRWGIPLVVGDRVFGAFALFGAVLLSLHPGVVLSVCGRGKGSAHPIRHCLRGIPPAGRLLVT